MKRKISLLLVLLIVLSLFASCAPAENTPTPTPTAAVTATATASAAPTPGVEENTAATQTFTDSVDRTVELPANITKISPSGALAQMFLIAIAPDLLVSKASEYSDYSAQYVPEELADLPVVGQFYGSDNLNYESIAAINPEVVIDLGEPKGTIVEDMDSITEKLAIPAVHITADLRSTPEAFRTLGRLLGREEKAEQLAAFIERTLQQTDAVLAQVGNDKVRALYLTGDAGLNVIAQTSFHAEVFDYIADNIAVVTEPSSRGTGNETDLEQISLWNPDLIFFSSDSIYGTAASDPTWSGLDAIRTGSYYEVPNGPYNWFGGPPSIQRYLFMLWATQILYPQYASYDLYSQVAEYYSLFYGYELSREKFSELLGYETAAAELTIAAAASLTDVLTKIGDAFMAEYPNIKLVFSFGSSGALQTQIEEGAPADVFLSAAQKQMDALDSSGFIAAGTRRNLLENKVVLVVPSNSTLELTSFEDVTTDKVSIAAIGDDGVPVGQYTREIYTALGTLDSVLAKATLGKDVREVLSWVESGDADCGIVYATDAATTTGVKVVASAPEGSHLPVIYPGAVLESSANRRAARQFLDYLSTYTAITAFEKAGFAIASK